MYPNERRRGGPRNVDLNTDQRLSSSMVTLFALACGLSAANLYYAQPVLSSISKSFHTNSSGVGLVVTFAQIGYALGLAFVVPLGDVLARRRLVPGVLLLTCASLIVCAFAPSASVLIAVSLFVGLGSVAAQILVPMAASLSAPSERGRVVGTVMSGLLLGSCSPHHLGCDRRTLELAYRLHRGRGDGPRARRRALQASPR